MRDIDRVLRESFQRLAEPGDPTGVAEVVRARVDAGDVGTPSDGGPGFAGGDGGFGGFGGGFWKLWAGAGVIAGVGGLALGASGVLDAAAGAAPTLGYSVSHTVPGLDCPGGAPVISFHPGDRVLAVARSDDGGWLAVRNPLDRTGTVWLSLDGLVVDDGQEPVETLAVDGCPVPELLLAEPSPEPEEDEEPEDPSDGEPEPDEPGPQPSATPDQRPSSPAPQPAEPGQRPTTPTTPKPRPGSSPTTPPPSPDPTTPPPDTTAPVITSITRQHATIGCKNFGLPESVRITVNATDDVAVDRVTLQASGLHTIPPFDMAKQGGAWVYTFTPPDNSRGDVIFTAQAFDAAGNTSATRSVGVFVDCLF